MSKCQFPHVSISPRILAAEAEKRNTEEPHRIHFNDKLSV